MHRCLSCAELDALLAQEADGVPIADPELATWVEHACGWDVELGAHSLFVCRILETLADRPSRRTRYTEAFYALPQRMYVYSEDMDDRFVSYMLRHLRQGELSLEEQLVEILTWYREYRYDQALHG